MLVTQEQLDGMAMIGYQLYQDGKLDDAHTFFEGLTVIARESSYGYAGLGAIALAKEPPDLDGALQNLSIAVELSPESPTLHANLGEALLRKREFEQARVEFQKALDLDPEKKDPGANRARAIIEALKIAVAELRKLVAQATPAAPAEPAAPAASA